MLSVLRNKVARPLDKQAVGVETTVQLMPVLTSIIMVSLKWHKGPPGQDGRRI